MSAMNGRDERYAKGMEILHKLTDDKGMQQIKEVRNFYPDFEDKMVAFGYGEIWSTSWLDIKQRELITLSSLITQGAFEQLKFHIFGALRVGLKPNEIIELIMHCAAYAGFPKALSALKIVMDIFEEHNIQVEKGSSSEESS